MNDHRKGLFRTPLGAALLTGAIYAGLRQGLEAYTSEYCHTLAEIATALTFGGLVTSTVAALGPCLCRREGGLIVSAIAWAAPHALLLSLFFVLNLFTPIRYRWIFTDATVYITVFGGQLTANGILALGISTMYRTPRSFRVFLLGALGGLPTVLLGVALMASQVERTLDLEALLLGGFILLNIFSMVAATWPADRAVRSASGKTSVTAGRPEASGSAGPVEQVPLKGA